MKNYINFIKILFFLIILMTSCRNNDNVISINQAKRSINDIQTDIFAGDTSAYQELRIVYLDYPPDAILFWALFMKNKYHYPEAGLDVARSLLFSYNRHIENFDEIDSETQKIIIESLKFASKEGVIEADYLLGEIKKSKIKQ